MYSPANSTFLIHESWNISSPRSAGAPPATVVDDPDAAGFDELPHAARMRGHPACPQQRDTDTARGTAPQERAPIERELS